MIDIHLIDDRHVEIIQDQALRDMPGEVGVAFHVGHLAWAPALVRRLVELAAADREALQLAFAQQRPGATLRVADPHLANVGRCDHTYLHHIVERYEALADGTLFLKVR